jgi:hypothetical protein
MQGSKKHHREGNIEIYRRILKYSPFALKRRKGIHHSVHRLDTGGTITAVAHEVVTVEDAEKLYALILHGQADEIKTVCNNFSVVAVHCKLSDIKNNTKCHDYKKIVRALERVAGMTLKYEYAADDILITHIIHKITMKKDTVTAMFDADFFRACQEKSLTLHFPTYQQLTPVGKNLYGFLISNSGNVFSEDLLLERCGIGKGRKDKMQHVLKRALQELTDKAIIITYDVIKKNGKRMYQIHRVRETIDV